MALVQVVVLVVVATNVKSWRQMFTWPVERCTREAAFRSKRLAVLTLSDSIYKIWEAHMRAPKQGILKL